MKLEEIRVRMREDDLKEKKSPKFPFYHVLNEGSHEREGNKSGALECDAKRFEGTCMCNVKERKK